MEGEREREREREVPSALKALAFPRIRQKRMGRKDKNPTFLRAIPSSNAHFRWDNNPRGPGKAHTDGFDHINRNPPVLIRTPKLTRFEPAQYWGGGPPGNSVVLNPTYFFRKFWMSFPQQETTWLRRYVQVVVNFVGVGSRPPDVHCHRRGRVEKIWRYRDSSPGQADHNRLC